MNSVNRLNRWLTKDNFEDICQMYWADGGLATEKTLQEGLCRICYKNFYAPFQPFGDEGRSLSQEMAAAVWDCKMHMSNEHPEVWELMGKTLHTNRKPFI